jgi:site-specific DNA recombinase
VTIVDIYCRVSTDPQEDNSSLDEQEQAGRDYCRANGLVIGMVHREVFSGYQYREREKLDLLRERYRSGLIQGVVIRTLDRLSRSQVHNAILMEEMEHHEVTLYCVKESIDDTPMGKFIRMVLAFVAEMEREKIMDRTMTGRINRAKEGKIVSGSKAPYGWQWKYDDTGNKQVILYPEEAAVLRWLAEQYAEGVAAHGLRNQLNAQGIPSPTGIAWNETSIVRLLSDPRITGKNAKIFAYQKRKTKQPLEPIDLPDGTYPAIISEELFALVQRRRDTNKADAIRASKEPEEYLLRAGFVKCAYCNKFMGAVKHRKHYTYRCIHGEGGHGNTILAKKLDALIWQWLQQLADHVSIIEQAIALATNSDTLEQDTKAIEQSIKTWQTKAANYLADLDDNNLIDDSRTAIRNEMNNANRMVVQLRKEREQLTAGMIDREKEQAAYQDILNWCKKVKESREELSYQRKRDFLRMLGVVVVIENVKPFYEHTIYHVEIALPKIQELISPQAWVNSDASSGDGVGSPLG